MARIRSTKPEFWSDTRFAKLEALPRLVFLCLWSMADDEGRIEGDADAVTNFGRFVEGSRNVASALRVLAQLKRITIYEVDGNPYIAVNNFLKHQRIDHPSKSRIPAPSNGCDLFDEDSRELCESSRILAPDQGSGNRDQGSGSSRRAPRAAGTERPAAPVLVDLPALVADGLTEQTASEWLEHRKRKRARLTDRAWGDIKAEVKKTGWALEAAVRKALNRGWTGIEADWLARSNAGASTGAGKQAALEARNQAAAEEWLRQKEAEDAAA